jgi:hypothetical protein
MKINKTQQLLIERLDGKFGTGNLKQGWTLTNSKDCRFISLQKLNEGEQAHCLAENFPDKYKTKQIAFRLVHLYKL